MKRIALFLVFLLVVSSVPCTVSAERIDFSGLSLDGLIMLKTWINEEIAERTKNDKEVCVPVGEYIVGADIPVGTYTISNRDSWHAQVHQYTAAGNLIMFYSIGENENIGKISLQDGQIIQITLNSVYFSIYKGLDF